MSKRPSSSSSSSSAVAVAEGGKKKGRAAEKVVSAHEPVTESVDTVLAIVRAQRKHIKAIDDVTSHLDGITEAEDLNPAEVSTRLESLVIDIVQQILATNTFELTMPSRASTNQKYLEDIDRIVLGDKTSKRMFLNVNHVRKAAITTRVVELVHEVLSKGIHITKRDLFYTDVKLFKDQGESDKVLDDVACMAGCTRTSLHVIASDKGLVVGRIQYREAGDLIDCTRMGIGGKAIPPYIDRITDIQSDAEFIILVEKEAVYLRLAEDRFYEKYPCIIITGKGQPDVATRLFLRKVRDEIKIPVLALVDADPYGLKILSVYCSGSKQMSYDSNHLTTNDIKWLGVRPSDLDRYQLPAQCRLDMTEHDKKMGEELLKEPFILKHPEWVKELELMMKLGVKAEIQALSSFGFQFITEQFLPRKLLEGDWI
ncbi:topoisomerase [Ochromonadaceae sp. CCMP2298]|nr:topoisomerase [Ochromonadaceae sp. CCMP2298]